VSTNVFVFRKCVKKVKCVKNSLFSRILLFFTHFREKTKLHVRKEQTTFFHLFFLLVLKMAVFSKVRVEGWVHKSIEKKCVKKSYFVFNVLCIIS
jgi:1-acyl-sn-glycerol-3-phosphate acyltransferase